MPLSDGLDTRPCKIVDPHLDTETAVCRVEYAETETKFTLWSYHVLYIQHSEIVSDCKPNLFFYCNFVECSEKICMHVSCTLPCFRTAAYILKYDKRLT